MIQPWKSINAGLVCPICRGALSSQREQIQCKSCDRHWPVVDGVPYFKDSDNYWAEPGITREVASQMIQEIRFKNWKDVLKNHLAPSVRQNYQFITDTGRANWHQMLDLSKDSLVLDLGAGTGTISQALSKHYQYIYAVERVKERVEFMSIRFRQEKCENISLIRTDIDFLPFLENYFDLIVLNGVLEWLPFNRKQDNPRSAQLFYLKLLKKLLKPDGVLYVGIENRTDYRYFVGAPDPHISIKFVTILPRWISHVICKIRTGEKYRPYLYSLWGYKRLVSNAGYHSVEIYSAIPSYNDPRKILNMKEKSVNFIDSIWNSKRSLSRWVKKILVHFDLLKYCGHSYIIFGRKK